MILLKRPVLIVLPLVLLLVAVNSWATVISGDVTEYAAGAYTMPENYTTIATNTHISLEHGTYLLWEIDDIDSSEITSVDIVFSNICNWTFERDDQLAVYIADLDRVPGHGSVYTGTDMQSTSYPSWAVWESVGIWSDSNDMLTKSDVVFSITDTDTLNYLINGGSFTIGIDPDCFYRADSITVNVGTAVPSPEPSPEPVPEPGTLLLLGMGLLSATGLRKKKSK